MRTKSILTEAKQIDRAVTLIQLGARLQVLESETDLSYERLLRLYKEVSGKVAEMDEIDVVIKAYQLYQEQTAAQNLEQLLSVTRAWRLVKFVDNGMLTMTRCSKCGGHFVTHPHEVAKHYVCGLCNPPARAGKGKAAGGIQMH